MISTSIYYIYQIDSLNIFDDLKNLIIDCGKGWCSDD